MISITNLTKTPVDKKLLRGIAKKVLKGENILTGKDLSVVFLNAEKIKQLNKKYRGKDKATDVLSFEGTNEIVICPEMAENIPFVLIHGILHLLGYAHEGSKQEAEKMQKREKYYLSRIE